MLITSEDGELPRDTVVRVYYGGADPDEPEEFHLDTAGEHYVLFCRVTDHDGNEIDAGVQGAGGEAGAPGDASSVEAIRCQMWTDGSAKLEVESSQHPVKQLSLEPKKDVCTVRTDFVIRRGDAGT